jgi:Predicted dehydrogenases and related proteins
MIQVALLGAGMMGKTHADRYLANMNCKIKFVFDYNIEKAELLAKSVGAKAADNYEEILSSEVDIVDICLPTFLHKEFCIKAANSQKNILCEKPLALSMDECGEIINAVNMNHVKYMVAHVIRFWPEYMYIKQLVESNEMGRLIYINSGRMQALPTWTDGNWMTNPKLSLGGVIDLQIHDLDFIIWLLGRPGRLKSIGNKSKMGGYEQITTVMEHENGSVSCVEACNLMPSKHPFVARTRAVFEDGSVEFDTSAQKSFKVYKGQSDAEFPVLSGPDGYQNEIDYFIDCVDNDKPILHVTPEEAMFSLYLALKTKESLDIGKEIVLQY